MSDQRTMGSMCGQWGFELSVDGSFGGGYMLTLLVDRDGMCWFKLDDSTSISVAEMSADELREFGMACMDMAQHLESREVVS